jgi:hypothetical protein
MSVRMKVAGWLVGAALVAAVLGTGAREAFATSASSSCPNDGYNSVGWQPSIGACWNACYLVHEDELAWSNWSEATGCCHCFL